VREYLVYHETRNVHLFQAQHFICEAENFQCPLHTVIEQEIAQTETGEVSIVFLLSRCRWQAKRELVTGT
jgi:hypothetical protein